MAPPTESPTTEDVFALLNHVLSGARLRLRQEARPIAFQVASSGDSGDTWLFDPKADGALFARTPVADDAPLLRVRCQPALLARLVTDPDFELRDDDDAVFEGDLNDLLRLVTAFEESKNAIGIRAAKDPR